MKSRAITFFQAPNILQYISVMQLPEFQTVWCPALYIHKLQQIKTTLGWFATVRQHSQTGPALPVALPLLQWARCHLLCKVIYKHFIGKTSLLTFHSLGYELLPTVVMLSSWPAVHVQQYLLDSAWCNVCPAPLGTKQVPVWCQGHSLSSGFSRAQTLWFTDSVFLPFHIPDI